MTDDGTSLPARIPPEVFRDYLRAAGLEAGFRILLARAVASRGIFEGCCDSALEIEAFLRASPPPEFLLEFLRSLLKPRDSGVVLRVAREDLGPGESEIFPGESTARVLDSLFRAWSRAWTPYSIQSGGIPDCPPTVEAIPSSAFPGGNPVRSRGQRAPDGFIVEAEPGYLNRILDETERFLDLTGAEGSQGLSGIRERIVLVRYLAGTLQNAFVPSDDPFDFLDVRESEDPAVRALKSIVDRSFRIEERLVRIADLPEGCMEPVGVSEDVVPDREHRTPQAKSVRVHQLIGAPAAPGRAEGLAERFFRSGALADLSIKPEPYGNGRPPVLLCDRLDRDLLAAFPDAVAVAERYGGRLGLGAFIARSVGLPCVSGVRDLERIPRGAALIVDGTLGLVSRIGAME